MNITTEVEEIELEVDFGEGEYEQISVDIRISADMSWQSAKLSGPPEDCYPEESECDITETKILDAFDCNEKEIKLTPERIAAISDALESCDFEEELWDAFEAAQEPDCD